MIESLNLEVLRSKRKTSKIDILPGKIVRISAPENFTDEEVVELVNKRSRWIIEKLRDVKEKKKARVREIVNGESFPFLGKDYRLKIVEEGEVYISDGRLFVPASENIKELLINWYKEECLSYLSERVSFYTRKLVVEADSVSINELEKGWSSCRHNSDLVFDWRIILASKSVCDYVIAHEVCHIDLGGHGNAFWKLMKTIKPGFEADREWLELNDLKDIF